MTPWHLGRLAPLDFESSGVDPEEAFIVTCCLAFVGGGGETVVREWLLSPGDREIPEGAVAIHGIETKVAKAKGQPHAEGIEEIAQAVAGALINGVPLVGHNIGSYDLNLLHAECVREGVATIADRVKDGGVWPVIDTMVLDKHVAPFRRRVSPTQGPYQLRTTAQTYGLLWSEDEAHGSTYDALMSARAAWHIGQIAHTPHDQRPEWVRRLRTQRFNEVAGLYLDELHNAQATWAAQQNEELAAFKGFTARPGWPLFDPAVEVAP